MSSDGGGYSAHATGPTAHLCDRCGALVGNPRFHTAWHDSPDGKPVWLVTPNDNSLGYPQYGPFATEGAAVEFAGRLSLADGSTWCYGPVGSAAYR